MRPFAAGLLFGVFLICQMGCSPKADTKSGDAAPIKKDDMKDAKAPPLPPPPDKK